MSFMTAHATEKSTSFEAAFKEIGELFPSQFTQSDAILEHHSHGESWHPAAAPGGVFFAESTEQVSQVVALCNRHSVPIIPFGIGSCIEGQVQAIHGGLTIDLSKMNEIVAIHASDMDCVVQAGVTRQQLNEELRASGLFFPIDIGAHATMGGLASTRASGTTTVRYGTMRDLVLSMTVVLPDGEIIRTGQRARKSSAGYDLARLFIGSEGTLCIITELTVRLFGIPEEAQAGMCSFETIEGATKMVVEALQLGLCLNRIELADSLQMYAINRYSKTDLPEKPTLFLDLTGSVANVSHDLAILEELATDNGAISFEKAENKDAYNALWKIRHDALWASRALKPGAKGISTDVCVPISQLPQCISSIQDVVAESGLLAPLVGHVGDGNFHLVLLFDPDSEEEFKIAESVNAKLVHMAVEMGGTCTGEHGVGIGKKAYLDMELGGAVGVMRSIKRAIDPKNIMNPGKIFDL